MQKSKIRDVARALRARKARRIIFTDIDGTVYQWQLLIDLVLVIAKHYPNKRPIVEPLRKAINQYKKRVLSFSIVIKILITIIPDVFKGVNKKMVKKFAATRARNVGSRVYLFPKTLIDVALEIVDDPWLIVAITGSPQEVADPFCHQLGIHVAIGSFYKSDKNGLYTGVRDIDSGINKGVYVEAIAEECPEIVWEECIALGDSETDLPMFERCGYAVAINPNEPLLDHIRTAEKTIRMVRCGQKSGTQIYTRDGYGLFTEHCADCTLPTDVGARFPKLPGMAEKGICICDHE
ncbi:MAG: HAD-IB family phosphatase [Patescibacteria group bacterium]|nr:HAD-IB family phosphatase [Patescibacteria group bacterium]